MFSTTMMLNYIGEHLLHKINIGLQSATPTHFPQLTKIRELLLIMWYNLMVRAWKSILALAFRSIK